jgi:hypothetical protein
LKLFGGPPPEAPHPYAIDPAVRPAKRAAVAASYERRAPRSRLPIMIIGILAGAVLGVVLLSDDPGKLTAEPRKLLAEASGKTGYLNCVHVRLVGAAPLKKGDAGYSRDLDVDGDGTACEPILADGSEASTAKDTAEEKPAADPPKRKKKRS